MTRKSVFIFASSCSFRVSAWNDLKCHVRMRLFGLQVTKTRKIDGCPVIGRGQRPEFAYSVKDIIISLL